MRLLLLTTLAACTGPPLDVFTETWAECADGRSESCDARLADDFGAEGMPEWWFDGAWELAWVSAQLVEDVEEDEYVRAPMLRWVRGSSGDTPGERLYNRVASASVETVVGETGDHGASYKDGTVTWRDSDSIPQSVALGIVHEAGHEVGPGHEPCPFREQLGCDTSWRGAYAKEMGAAQWGAQVGDTPQRVGVYTSYRDSTRIQVLAD